LLSWMQDKKAPVFIVETANDVTQLPPEFLRKGRFDEIFFCDLPTKKERTEIWKIQIKKYGRSASKYKITDLVAATKGFTGAEIEQLFIESMYVAFGRDGKEPKTADLLGAIMTTVPLSQMMADQVKAIQDWASNRARPSSIKEGNSAAKKGRKITA